MRDFFSRPHRRPDRLLDPGRLWRTLPSALAATPRPGRIERVELKAVTNGPVDAALSALGTSLAKPQARSVYYLDTPDLDLYHRGLVARVRLTGKNRADAVVKLRSSAPDVPPVSRRMVPVELDALPAAVIWTSSIKCRLCPRAVRSALGTRHPARRLLSGSQRALLADAAGPDFDVDDLVALGPVDVVRLTSPLARGRIAVEAWRFPDDSPIVELSAKCRPAGLSQTIAELRNRIAEGGIALPDCQATKTQTSLERLVATAPAG